MVKPGMPYLDVVRDVKQRVWLATVYSFTNVEGTPDTITNYTVFACDVNSQHRKSMDYKIVDVNSLPLHHVHINKLYSLETKLLSDDKFYSPTQYPNHPLAIYQVRTILCHDCRNSYIFLGVTKVLCVPGFQWKVDVHTPNQWFLHVSCFGTEKSYIKYCDRWA